MLSQILKNFEILKLGMITGLLITAIACQPQNSNLGSNITLVADDEPGESLVVDGTVYAPDGKTPLRGIIIYVYHTDSDGKYNSLNLGRPLGMPRIEGTMATDSDGHYRFRSIRPAPYPNKKIKPHIHYKLTSSSYPEQKFKLSIVDTAIEDPFDFSDLCRPTVDSNGVSHCTFNIKLK